MKDPDSRRIAAPNAVPSSSRSDDSTDFHPAAGVPLKDRLKAATAAFVAILVVTTISEQFHAGAPSAVLMASMGASAVLLFVLPNSPLAQPWSFAMGHLVPALVGLCTAAVFRDFVLAAAVAVGVSLFAMYMLECVHPPGGSAALIPVIAAQEHPIGFDFLIFPVALNVATMLALAWALNRFWLGKRYPARAARTYDPVHRHDDAPPLQRVGIEMDDFRRALSQLDVFVDASEHDLHRVYQIAERHAHRRQIGEVRCGDIMSRDVVTVMPETPLEEAWALLRHHKIAILPVLDEERRVIGVISLVDFLKRASLKTYRTFAEELLHLVRPEVGPEDASRPDRVAEIMVEEPVTAREADHILEVVEMLTDRGLHQIPIVDAQGRLAGIVTQSDLIAALYAKAGGSMCSIGPDRPVQ